MASELEGNVILVIDDDAMNLQIAKMILEQKLPCRVITCDNGIQGLEILRRQYVRVVLLDINMPYFDGIQTLEEIRKDPKLKNIPVIMLTASTAKKHIAKAILHGVKDYIRKPFMHDELVERVSKRLGPVTNKSKQTILLIEEDEVNRKQIRRMLENHLPHEVVTISLGVEAIEALRKQKFNLVIASIDMRFINGFRIVEFMKNEPDLNRIPIFLTTPSEDLDTLEEIKNSGANGYLRVPIIDETSISPLIKFLESLA